MSEDIENISFDLVNEDAVKRLKKDGKIKVPEKKISVPKDMRWNEKQMASKILQGIQNGDSIDKISESLKDVIGNNQASSIRNARTMTTSAENQGRLDSYRKLEEKGVVLKKIWVATPDNRVRESHLNLDGEAVDINETFSNGLMKPGDGNGPAEEVWNCRCSMHSRTVGFRKKDGTISYVKGSPDKTMHAEQIEKQKEKRQAKPATAAKAANIVNGKDISATWTRRADKFAFEIEDVMNAQGFDGKPRVVSAEEFERYVEEANDGKGFIAQRTYSAPDQETLDEYRDQLYSGKWYVDCSTGGAQYGQGMYCAGNYDGKLTNEIIQEMKDYQGQNLNYSGKQSVHVVETFTLDKSANIVTQKDVTNSWIREYLPTQKAEHLVSLGIERDNIDIQDLAIKLMEEARKQEIVQQGLAPNEWKASDILRNEIKSMKMDFKEERNYWLKKAEEAGISTDIGSYAALKGYDAIRTSHGTCGADTIILNRTKCIFKKGK